MISTENNNVTPLEKAEFYLQMLINDIGESKVNSLFYREIYNILISRYGVDIDYKCLYAIHDPIVEQLIENTIEIKNDW